MDEADLLITHCGVGSIVSGMKHHKPIVVFPRLAKYAEHVDDHQLQIADAFEKMNYILVCRENDDLYECINNSLCHDFSIYESHKDIVISVLKEYLDSLERVEG